LGKALFYRQLEEKLGEAYEDASRTIAGNMDTDIAREGVDAFFDKRNPRWKTKARTAEAQRPQRNTEKR
jgi:1,4-dihydroxy-2-naphthoyl-CoA synthase